MKKAPGMGLMSPRKRMAAGDYGSSFGVKDYESVHGGSPITDGGKRGSGKSSLKGMKTPK